MLDNTLHKIDLTNSDAVTETAKVAPVKSITPDTGLAVKIVIYLFVAVLGAGSGYLLYTSTGGKLASQATTVNSQISATGLKVGDVVGVQDEKTFKDKPATGVLLQGGIGGEGSHHIVRDGGVSQTVYITSSVVDLEEFVGAKVTVWGDTFSSQKAGWLMDVSRVRVEELNAPTPAE